MWETEFTTTDPRGRRVEYKTRAAAGYSRAERPDRVLVSGKVVHQGWVSDHQGFEIFKLYQSGRIDPERKTS